MSEAPYRAAPAPTPKLVLHEHTSELGRAFPLALILIGAAATAAPAPSAVEPDCERTERGVRSDVVQYRALDTKQRAIDLRGLRTIDGAPDADLRDAAVRPSDGALLLPSEGLYRD